MTGAFAGSTVLRRESQNLCSHFSKTKEWVRFASHQRRNVLGVHPFGCSTTRDWPDCVLNQVLRCI